MSIPSIELPSISDKHSIEFHNVAAPEPFGAGDGLLLPRYPAEVRQVLSKQGKVHSRYSNGCEIRFVTDAPTVRVFLAGVESNAEVYVYRGDFCFGRFDIPNSRAPQVVPPGQITCIRHSIADRFEIVSPEVLRTGAFSPDVWRFVVGSGEVLFHGVDTFGHDIRPPQASEKPRIRWLAYGSSITESAWNGYPHQAASRLGVDVLNKGLGGSCRMEAEVVEFLADGCEWNFATCELGVNMRAEFSPAEFERRARYLIERFMSAQPGRPIVLITSFPNCAHHMKVPDLGSQNQRMFNNALRTLAGELAASSVHLLEGAEILPDFNLLTADLIHPSEYGHVQMGENLARSLRELLPELLGSP